MYNAAGQLVLYVMLGYIAQGILILFDCQRLSPLDGLKSKLLSLEHWFDCRNNSHEQAKTC